MNTLERGWRQNREEYLRKAYTAVGKNEEPVPLNEAVDSWNMLTENADNRYLWRALGNMRVIDRLDIQREGGSTLLEVDPDIAMEELETDVELEPGEKESVNISERTDYRNYRDFEVPEVPLFIPWEHAERHGHEIFPHESQDLRGITTVERNGEGKEKWLAFYNHDADREGSTALNQVFRGLQTSEGEEVLSPEDIFSERNRESYAETIWESEPLRIRQRSENVWGAAVEAVEEEIPRRVEEYERRAQENEWEKQEIDEFEALKREFRLMVGDEDYDHHDPTYIEQIVEDYYGEGLARNSPILQPYLERIESTPSQEGDMNLGEATRDSDTSREKKQRNQTYMSHFLDLVWQMTQEEYE